MAGPEAAALGFGALLLLLLLRVPVGLALLIAGAGGIFLIRPAAVVPVVAGELFAVASTYSLTILPMFMLMGNLAVVSGMSRDLYDAAHSWLGHYRGGLAAASIAGCAGFSALSGSSLASALTVGRVALPEMRRFGYDDSLATGTIAAGGTLGILIPPSTGFVIYAILTEESIGRLFLAGVLPGVLLALLFIAAIRLTVTRRPALAPRSAVRAPWGARFAAARRAAWIAGIIAVTIGGIYAGIFSAVEAAAAGALLALIGAAARRALTWKNLTGVVTGTLASTGTAFLILFGAFVFKTFIGFSEIVAAASLWVAAQGFSGLQVALAVLLMFMVLGAFMEGFTILVLAIPLAQPILETLGVDLIWFGVLIVITLEMGLISPPVGINVFVVKGIAREVPLHAIFRGIWPFWLAMLAAVLLIAAVPRIATLLPAVVYG